MFKSKRIVDPLDPTYKVPQLEGSRYEEIGFIDRSKTKIRHPYIVNRENSFSLKTVDISGAQINSTPNQYVKMKVTINNKPNHHYFIMIYYY